MDVAEDQVRHNPCYRPAWGSSGQYRRFSLAASVRILRGSVFSPWKASGKAVARRSARGRGRGKIGANQYVVALLPDGLTYILPPGAISGVLSRQAKPGESITMYGIGFGAVSPNIPAGQIVTQSNQLAAPFQVLFGQTPAQLQYYGLGPNFAGLYQFNVVVPAVPNNDLTPLTFSLGGTASTQTLYVAVKQKGRAPPSRAYQLLTVVEWNL